MFIIRHPGTGEYMKFKSFEKAMKYFEGWNIPYKLIGKDMEDTETAKKRVELYLLEKKNAVL